MTELLTLQAADLLSRGFSALGIQASPDPFICYLELISKWNKVHNLTAIRTLPLMVTHHLLDSLVILPYLKGPHLIDVGSGPGFPGIPIALLNPALHVVLVDSNSKKTRFLHEVKRVLNLKNIDIVHERIESYQALAAFDTVMSRAFSHLEKMVQWTEHLIAPDGQWLAMKGHYPEDELKTLTYPYEVKVCHVPGLNEKRCCVIINNQ